METHDWERISYVRAVCPNCERNGVYFSDVYPFGKGSIVTCHNKKCEKQFKLGEQE